MLILAIMIVIWATLPIGVESLWVHIDNEMLVIWCMTLLPGDDLMIVGTVSVERVELVYIDVYADIAIVL